MDINHLTNISSKVIRDAAGERGNIGRLSTYSGLLGDAITVERRDGDPNNVFQTMLDTAVNNLITTNGYLSDAENEQMRWALGETQNTHELAIALSKANTALTYTVTVRDKFLDAYKEIMQMQI